MYVEFNANLTRLLGYHFDVRYSLSHQKPKVSKCPPNLTGKHSLGLRLLRFGQTRSGRRH